MHPLPVSNDSRTDSDNSSDRLTVVGPSAVEPQIKPSLIRTDNFRRTIRVLVDLLATTLAVLVATWWMTILEPNHGAHGLPGWMLALYVPVVVVLLGARKVYRSNLNWKLIDVLGAIFAAVAIAAMITLVLQMSFNTMAARSSLGVLLWACTVAFILLGRFCVRAGSRLLGIDDRLAVPTLIIGSGKVAERVAARLKASPEYGMLPVGLLDYAPPEVKIKSPRFPTVPYLGSPEDLEAIARDVRAQNVVVAFSKGRDEVLADVIHSVHRSGLRVWVVPRLFDAIGRRAYIEHVGGLPLMALSYTNPQGWQFKVKHATDYILAGLGLLLISPLFLTLMLLVRFSSPGPIFFGQERVGRDGKVFKCLKFRSMREAPNEGFQLVEGSAPGGVEGVDRRTWIGKILRATSLDELPQLINVLKGEMSLVGPRPERPEFVDLFEMQIQRYGERHRVKAGITGWAQVHGLRGQTSIADRAEWDNYYIENWSLWLDLKILLLTVVAVFRGAE